MDATPRASTNEPGSGNGNNTNGTGVAMCHMRRLLPTRQQTQRLRRRIFQRAVMKRSWRPSKFCISQFIPYTIIASGRLITVTKLSIFYRTPYLRHPNSV